MNTCSTNADMINTLVSNIKGRQYGGSSLEDGRLYHNLPFPVFDIIKSHRTQTVLRWDQIKGYITSGSTVLDLGCNVGAFSILASRAGASKVVGIDYDLQSIEIGEYVARSMELDNVEFRCRDIGSELIDEIEAFDVTLWLSQWMWLVKRLGMDEAKRLLFKMSAKSKLMIFESAADDGSAGICGMTQRDIESIFRSNVCYTRVKNIGNRDEWYKRNVLVGRRGPTQWKGYASKVERIEPNRVRKTFRENYVWMIDRAKEALRRLDKSNHFPKFLSRGDNYFDMTYCGYKRRRYDKLQCLEIVRELKEAGIVHRDIGKKNLLRMNDGTVCLVDFGWSLFDGEKENVPFTTLGTRYYESGVWDDERAMGIVISEIGV